MRYAIAFITLAVGCAALAATRGGWWWASLWPAVSFALVALGYAGLGPRVLGKRPDGRIAAWSLALMLPFLLFTWAVWHATRLLSPGPSAHEVAPGLWVGRRAFARELPPGTRLVVDLTSEFRAACPAADGRAYVCLPTLDGSAPPPPPDASTAALLDRIAAESARGPVFIHCAQGRGRSVAVAAAALIARGLAGNADEAEALIAKSRPSVRLNPAQRSWVNRVAASLREQQL